MSPDRVMTAQRRRSTPSSPERSSPESIGTPCIDGMTLSAADVQRAADKLALEQETIRKAVYAVAGRVENAEECKALFEMMGIDMATVRAVRAARAHA